MEPFDLKKTRKLLGWTQQCAAQNLEVSQALVSMVETGERALTPKMLTRLARYFEVDPVYMPLRKSVELTDLDLVNELAALGYPGFAHRKEAKPSWNPAQLLVVALSFPMLDRRVAEALPWLPLKYTHMDWEWVLREAKLRDLQNRLGFVVTLAQELAGKNNLNSSETLMKVADRVEGSRLAGLDTYCNERMTQAERSWLKNNAPPEAKHWNLLTDLRTEHLMHAV